jgi:hypothetical protein
MRRRRRWPIELVDTSTMAVEDASQRVLAWVRRCLEDEGVSPHSREGVADGSTSRPEPSNTMLTP